VAYPRDLCPRLTEEAVFSSSEDRIRAAQAAIAVSDVARQLWTGFARAAAQGLFSVLFPADCRICGFPLLNISRLPVCTECLTSIHPIAGAVCSVCGERVLSSYAHADDDGLTRCPICRRIDRPFERAVAYGSYDGALRELVHLLKYSGVRPAANVLGRMLSETFTSLQPCFAPAPVLIVPVPLYKSKRRQRGFNQSELIVRAALKVHPARNRFQIAEDLLQRTRDTHSQIGLTSHQRRENLRGAFHVSGARKVTGREVLLIDDVYTTGTTVTECARVLRRAGASRVWVATVARTLKLASKYQDSEQFEASREEAFEPSTSPAFHGSSEPERLESLKL
jgi:ComF family protein